MNYKVISCEGYLQAMLGAMLSYGKTSWDDLLNYPDIRKDVDDRMADLSLKLVKAGSGHNKFLEQIQYWIAIKAPLFWWKQFDTYRIGISKSSESTMHRSWKKGLTQEMFESPIFSSTLEELNRCIQIWEGDPDVTHKRFMENQIINNLPDGYLQTRLVNINAKALRHIYFQRRDHKLQQWREFCQWLQGIPFGTLITVEES